MKTKNKILALLEIAIVLYSVFLVAIPAIAAEQSTQASTSTITTASEDDYVLGIYGNANEDDTIDMRDLTYVKLIFFGKKPETELADAKYDGKINPLDFIQIKLIIVGKEKELTIVQYLKSVQELEYTEKPVTVKKPIERIVAPGTTCVEALCAFGVQDSIVAVDDYAKKKGELKIFVEDKPSIGKSTDWDMEKIMELKPDIVLVYAYKYLPDEEEKLNAAGISLVQMDFYKPVKYSREIRNLGWMLDKQKRAEELINFEQLHINLIKERVKDLQDEHKPQVYWESYRDYRTVGPGSPYHNSIIMCGGINIFADAPKSTFNVDPEAVIEKNPQVIFRYVAASLPCGYDVTDTGPMEKVRNDIMSSPCWDHIDAVKDGRVYIISCDARSTHTSIFSSYIAKWLHPELFEDIDPVDIHREWFQKFFGIEYKGVYAYPTYPVS